MSRPTGHYFPPEYKVFPFKEGDLLARRWRSGRFGISKVLKIDEVAVKKGFSIAIQGQSFTAPEDDCLLIISSAGGTDDFDSLEQARAAAQSGAWTVKVRHFPNRAPGACDGAVHVGWAPVTDAELEGYRLWRELFDRGEAGTF